MRNALLALACLAPLTLAAAPKQPATGCRGKISGAVTAEFGCIADVVTTDAGTPIFTITPRDAIADVPVYKPGSFELPAAPAARTYTLEDLGMGLATLAAESGTLYTAAKTSGQRGEVTLTLRSAKRDPSQAGKWIVHGTYRARLLPAGAGKTGEIVFEVSF